LLTLASALDLTTKIIGALKEAGGASDEYQHAFIEIEGLQRTLQNVAKLVPTENNLELSMLSEDWLCRASDRSRSF
jgi:hypothetical protein